MTLNEAEKLLIENKGGKAYREVWNNKYTNDHIFYDERYGSIDRTTCDWPAKYYPSTEDVLATDFIYEPA
jgi:hypothetical protein